MHHLILLGGERHYEDKNKGKGTDIGMEEEDCVTSPKSICIDQANPALYGLVLGGLIFNSSTLYILANWSASNQFGFLSSFCLFNKVFHV